jgi:hypothetical protein
VEIWLVSLFHFSLVRHGPSWWPNQQHVKSSQGHRRAVASFPGLQTGFRTLASLFPCFVLLLLSLLGLLKPSFLCCPVFSGSGRGRSRDDSLTNTMVKIQSGPWKGYRGRVKDATDTTVRIELDSQMKTITVNKNQLKASDGRGNREEPDRYYPQTPSRAYPQTPSREYPKTPARETMGKSPAYICLPFEGGEAYHCSLAVRTLWVNVLVDGGVSMGAFMHGRCKEERASLGPHTAQTRLFRHP